MGLLTERRLLVHTRGESRWQRSVVKMAHNVSGEDLFWQSNRVEEWTVLMIGMCLDLSSYANASL